VADLQIGHRGTAVAADDREQLFEKALARHVRQSASPDSSAISSNACPDAEALASYHERLLPLEELHRWKQHLAACERCRDILAQLELTADLAVADPSADPAQAFVSADSEARLPSATSSNRSPAEAAPLEGPVSSTKAVSSSARGHYWRWVAPAGAVAAGLLIWATWHENRPLSLTALPASSRHQELAPDSSSKTQSNTGPQAERNSDKLLAPSAPASGFLYEKKTAELRGKQIPSAKSDTAEPNASRGAELRKHPQSPLSPRPTAGPSNRGPQEQSTNTLQQASRQTRLSPAAAATGGMAGAKQESAAPPLNAPLSGSSAASPSPSAPPAPALRPALSEEASLAQKSPNQKDTRSLAPSATTAESTQPLAAMDHTSATVTPSGARLIYAPDRKVVWKIDQNGAVTRSTDSGETWQPQNTGTSAPLRAGSAPSGSVCWLAGDSGVVVLTTDGGAHWTVVTPPVNGAVSEIVAADARSATVTLRFSKIRFRTSDGGQTWHLVEH